MKLIVSGKTKEFTPKVEEKFGAKIAKLSKFIEQRGEREAHVTHQLERRIHKVELTVRFYDHALVGEGADADLDTALNQAVEKLEKQVVKLRERWRDTHRDAKMVRSIKESWDTGTAEVANDKAAKSAKGKTNGRASVVSAKPKIFRVDYSDNEKPMTLDEAILEMEGPLNYVVYRDARRDCLSVLVRRPDGGLDLIES
jgi:putative sigma-54 modulation protein